MCTCLLLVEIDTVWTDLVLRTIYNNVLLSYHVITIITIIVFEKVLVKKTLKNIVQVSKIAW